MLADQVHGNIVTKMDRTLPGTPLQVPVIQRPLSGKGRLVFVSPKQVPPLEPANCYHGSDFQEKRVRTWLGSPLYSVIYLRKKGESGLRRECMEPGDDGRC